MDHWSDGAEVSDAWLHQLIGAGQSDATFVAWMLESEQKSYVEMAARLIGGRRRVCFSIAGVEDDVTARAMQLLNEN
jgi:hypothetical protein